MTKIKDSRGKESFEEFTGDDKNLSLTKSVIPNRAARDAAVKFPLAASGGPTPLPKSVEDLSGLASPSSADDPDTTLKISSFKFLECTPLIPGE